jgi:hypothetical protein
MRHLGRLARAIGLAAALLLGQQAAALHDLAHAKEQLSQKDAKPGSTTCDQCFACAELSGAMGTTPPALPAGCASATRFDVSLARGVAAAPLLLAFRSQAPPSLL